jgi:enoyl-CoA hydratase/carnithine racemase
MIVLPIYRLCNYGCRVDPHAFEHILYSVDDGVALITLNRPDRGNAWSGPMSIEYRWALHHAHVDPAARVIVLTGAGSQFCVGADTGDLAAIADAQGSYTPTKSDLPPFPDDTPAGLRHNHSAPLTIDVPVIAAINGGCAGAGFVLATYADLRWAAVSARVASSFAGLGLPAEYGIGWMLPRLVGTANAFQLLLDPSPRSAEAMAQLGFVQRVVADAELLPAVLDFAKTIARHSSAGSLRTIKRAIVNDSVGDFDTAYRRSVDDMNTALRHPDLQIGLQAARDKRRPDFLEN